MSEMVERVARKIIEFCRREDARFDRDWDALTDGERSFMKDCAYEAIAAMREPTEAMQLVGHNVRSDPATGLPTHCGIDEIWTAMNDAALED